MITFLPMTRWCTLILFVMGASCASPEDGQVTGADVQDEGDVGSSPDLVPPEDTTDTSAVDSVNTEDTGPQACDPPLSMAETTIVVASFGYTTLVPMGGTGAYRFELITNASEAIVHPLSGAYLSGEVHGSQDVVRVTDDGCIGELDVTISVVSGPVVAPGSLKVPPNSCFQFAVSGGSGVFIFENMATKPVGVVSEGGFYQAGPKDGYDVIRVTDAETERFTDVVIEILVGAGLKITTQRLIIPLGSRVGVPFADGSGIFDISIEGSGVAHENAELIGNEVGTVLVTGTDAFVKCTEEDPEKAMAGQVTVDVVTGVVAPTEFYGENEPVLLAAPGDLNGDGFGDLVAGMPYNHSGGLRRGMVFVYRGTAEGLGAPEQSFVGTSRSSEYGRALAVGDLDGDGNPDLAVGAWLDDNVGNDRGSVRLYQGVEGGFFKQEQWIEYWGHYGGDRLGSAVAICDVNGDGREDLIATARRTEDKSAGKVTSDQGGIHVFLGSADGMPEKTSLTRYGVLPGAEGILQGIKSLEIGMNLAVGDFNGDGRCDVAASTINKGGRIVVYLGDELDGLSLFPVRILGPENDSHQNVGRAMASGDFNGDGADELAVGQYDYKNGNTKNTGVIYIFAGGDLPNEPSTFVEHLVGAEWMASHTGAYDRLGASLAIGDLNGDGFPDLVAGTYSDEVPGGESDTGTVNYYMGTEGGFPQLEPARMVPGLKKNDRLGWAVAILGDLNGDGWHEVAAHAREADDWGKNSGQLYTIWGEAPPVISLGDVWKYDDQGTDHGTGWLAADFDDSAWAEGPGQLGYGDDDEATTLLDSDPNVATVYFRKTIYLDKEPAWAELKVIYDDGVGVWVNGKLVFSQYMANGFEFDVPASSQSQTDNQVSVIQLGVEGAMPLVQGTNIIGVQVKQYSDSSSDLSFDFGLQTHPDMLNVDSPTQGMEVPMSTSNSRVGRSVAIVDDVTADGLPDLIMGASWATIGGMGNRTGVAFLYRGTTSGFESEPAQMWNEFPGNHNDAYTGYRVGSSDFFGDGQRDLLVMSHKSDLNTGFYNKDGKDDYTWDTVNNTCTNKNDGGGVFVFSSVPGASLPSLEPSFVYYSHKSGQRLNALASNVDYNGDGYEDLVVSSHEWDYKDAGNSGGIAFVKGRPPGAKREIVCAPDATFRGAGKDARMGWSLTGLGDLDGDGCGEVAVGSYLEDLGLSDQGTVRIFYGFGPGCTTAHTRVALLASGAQHSESAFALAGGKDIDGDGLPDLVVGAPDYRVDNVYYGAVYLIPGSYLASLPALGINNDETVPEQAAQPFEPPGSLGDWKVIGTLVDGRYGRSVSMIDGLGATGVAVAVGSSGDKNGLKYIGGLELLEYRVNAAKPGLQSNPIVILAGESYSVGGLLGQVSSGRHWGDSVYVAVGGWRASPLSNPDHRDDGGVYGMKLPESEVDEDAKGSPGFEEVDGGDDGGTDGGGPVTATWTGGVQEILAEYCGTCHTTDGKGNTNFASSYAEVTSISLVCPGKKLGECAVIRIENGSMPKGNGSSPGFDEIQLLKEWIAAGMPE